MVNSLNPRARRRRSSRQGRTEPEAELDELTLARAKRGDEGACRQLVIVYQRPVFALLSRMLVGSGRRAWVEDLAQETFLRVFRALPRYSVAGPARLSTWILTIATRLAIDELRKPPPSESLAEDGGLAPVSPDRADQALERRLLGQAIAQAVAALPEKNRAAFILREYHEMSYEAIARALGCDVGTVKSRLSRARSALRDALSERHPNRT